MDLEDGELQDKEEAVAAPAEAAGPAEATSKQSPLARTASRQGSPTELASKQGSLQRAARSPTAAEKPKVPVAKLSDLDSWAKPPSLRDLLGAARPEWTPGELSTAKSKLSKVGVSNLLELAEKVNGAGDVLNRRLMEAGLKTFSAETMAAIRKQLSLPEIVEGVDRARVRASAILAAKSLAGVTKPHRPGSGEVIAIRTSQTLGEFLSPLPAMRMAAHRAEGSPTVVVDPAVRYQTFLGFGGSFTESSAETLLQLSRRKQEQVVDACFRSDIGLGYRMGRVHINSCDFSKGNWACCPEVTDPMLSNFSIHRYKKAIIPFMHRAADVAGEPLKIVASPWSPPAWMKDNGAMTEGGALLKECQQMWAWHYVRFAHEFEQAGLPLWALTVQNEPNAPVSWESCTYTAEQERDFVRYFLGPTLQHSGMDLKLLVWDHNRDDMLARARVIYSEPEAARHVWGVAFHWYGDPRSERWPDKSGQLRYENVLRTHELRPDKHLVMTEACQEGGPHLGDWAIAERYAKNIIRDLGNWTEAWIDWNLILDDTGGPNHKRNFCAAPLIADIKRDQVFVQPSFYYIGHFSRHLLPGSQRILCASNRDALESIAVANDDGTIAVVVLNRSDHAVDFWLVLNQQASPALSPEHSITTFIMLGEEIESSTTAIPGGA